MHIEFSNTSAEKSGKALYDHQYNELKTVIDEATHASQAAVKLETVLKNGAEVLTRNDEQLGLSLNAKKMSEVSKQPEAETPAAPRPGSN